MSLEPMIFMPYSIKTMTANGQLCHYVTHYLSYLCNTPSIVIKCTPTERTSKTPSGSCVLQ